jgi:hypothetical protein
MICGAIAALAPAPLTYCCFLERRKALTAQGFALASRASSNFLHLTPLSAARAPTVPFIH